MVISSISVGNLAKNVAWAARKDLRNPILKSIVRQEELRSLRATIEIEKTPMITGTSTATTRSVTTSLKKKSAARFLSIFYLWLFFCTQT